MSDWQTSWEDAGPGRKCLWLFLGFLCIRALISPTSHRLSPDIGDDEYGRTGQVVGFHYEKRSWWGFRKQVFDSIRFAENQQPEYLDEKSGKWKAVPPEAWGEYQEDDRDIQMENRGYYEQ